MNSNVNKKRYIYILVAIIFTILVFLSVLGGGSLLKKRISEKQTKEATELIIILKNDLTGIEIIRFQKELELKQYITETEYVSEERKFDLIPEKQKTDYKDPLPKIIKVKLLPVYSNNDSILVVKNEIGKIFGVREVIMKFN